MAATQRPEVSDQAPTGIRLDCWKEIAVYLGRGERTVKRWEKDRGMPTHRVPGSGRTSVFAYSAELDEWLKSRMAADEPDGAEPPAGYAEAGAPRIERTHTREFSLLPAATRTPRDAQNTSKLRIWLGVAAALVLLSFVAASAEWHAWAKRSQARVRPTAAVATAGSPAASRTEQALSHDLYLRGRYEWNKRTPDSLNRALDLFTQAVVHDPGNALAYVGMADVYNLLFEYTGMPGNEAFPRAISAARKAVELDGSLAEAHRALAFAEMWGTWDFADAGRHFRRAMELNPQDPEAHKWYANAIGAPGSFDLALEHMNKAQELDPASNATLADKGILLFNAGRTREGVTLLKEVELAAPDFRSPHFYLMLIDFDLHDDEGYLNEGEQTARIMRDPVLRSIMASARAGYQQGGRRGMLAALYAKQKAYYSQGQVWGTMLAKTCIQMGRKNEAMQLLETAFANHEQYVLACVSSPDLLSLRDDPKYVSLLRKMNYSALTAPPENT